MGRVVLMTVNKRLAACSSVYSFLKQRLSISGWIREKTLPGVWKSKTVNKQTKNLVIPDTRDVQGFLVYFDGH
jgi:hypothetical protein